MLLETAPIMFFGGKGGVGKTTLATATALRLSRDHRVCLVSTDPAHNLGHIFGTALGDAPSAHPQRSPIRRAGGDLHAYRVIQGRNCDGIAQGQLREGDRDGNVPGHRLLE